MQAFLPIPYPHFYFLLKDGTLEVANKSFGEEWALLFKNSELKFPPKLLQISAAVQVVQVQRGKEK